VWDAEAPGTLGKNALPTAARSRLVGELASEAIANERGVCRAIGWSWGERPLQANADERRRTRRPCQNDRDGVTTVRAPSNTGAAAAREIVAGVTPARASGHARPTTDDPASGQALFGEGPRADADGDGAHAEPGLGVRLHLEQLMAGERIRVFSNVDECTRELKHSTAAASFPVRGVRSIVDETIAERSAQPARVRSDNGPEFIAGLML
jgi:hypothetical protein